MRLRSLLLCGLLLPGLQACAIHPLQQDVTSTKTTFLVDHIRCEAREAIITKALTLLEFNHGEHGRMLAAKLAEDRSKFVNFDPKMLDQHELEFYKAYVNNAIAYSFTFDIQEKNSASATLDVVKSLTNGVFSLGIGGEIDLSRQNSRRFVISDTFKYLLDHPEVCHGYTAHQNLAYPMDGQIGLAELIDTFIDLNENKALQIVEKAEVFADTLTFLTTLSASAAPKIVAAVRGRSLQVADFPVQSSASRVDKHEVIIGLSLGKIPGSHSTVRTTPSPLVGAIIPGANSAYRSGDDATSRAINATVNQRVSTFLDRY